MYIIDTVKLQKYIESGDILEFQSDQECLEYFNTYDHQNFNTVYEMKTYQGKYGFNIGNRRYHINTESAIDVKAVYFTEEELSMMSNGILALIHNAGIAKKQVNKNITKAIIDMEIRELISLNNKICGEIQEVY